MANLRIPGAVLVLLVAAGCSAPEYIASGSPSLIRFERIDPAALRNAIPKKDPPPIEPPPSPDDFLQNFRKELVHRLHRKKAFDLPSGPMLVLEGTLLRYEHDSRRPSGAHDTNLFAGFVEIDVVLKDETGAKIGAGRATVSGTGPTPDIALVHAERRAVWVIADYLRRQAKKGPVQAEPDEP